jgi:hypothetical protein
VNQPADPSHFSALAERSSAVNKAKNSAWQNSGLVGLPKELIGKVWFCNSALLVEWSFWDVTHCPGRSLGRCYTASGFEESKDIA